MKFRRFNLRKMTGQQQAFLVRIGFRVQMCQSGDYLVRWGK